MKHNVQVVQCSYNRCSGCPNQLDLRCQKLAIGNQNKEQSTILIEKSRGLLHVRFSGEPVLTEPPWFADGWESVFIGKDSNAFHNVMNLIAIYRIEPYVSLFYEEIDSHHVRYPSSKTKSYYTNISIAILMIF